MFDSQNPGHDPASSGIDRRGFIGALGASATGGVLFSRSASGAIQSSESVTVVHDTHFHGRFGDPEDPENIANYFGLMQQIADANENPLLVGNGDDLASSVLSSVFEGRHMIDAFDAGGLQFDTFGNHDFDMGPDALRKQILRGSTTWVSANVTDERTGKVFGRSQGARSFRLVQAGDVSVGVTGLITPEAPEITSMGKRTAVQDPAAALDETVPQMRDAGADAVVVLSHLTNSTAEEVARQVDGVDAIVGDHAAQVLEEPKVVGDTILSFVGDEFEFVGELTLNVRDGSVQDFEFTLHETAQAVEDSSFRTSESVRAVTEEYRSLLDERLDVVIGESTVPLDTRRAVVRSQESNFGNFVSDAIREEADADVALMNGGGIRSDTLYEPGDITKRTIVDILPFPNNVVKLEVSGETLLAALENGVSQLEDLAGRFPQVSGMAYSFDPNEPVGDRIVEATVDGESVDPDATYTLGTNDFVSGGGDGYEMLADATVLVPGNEGTLLSGLVTEVVQRRGTISPEVEGRITNVAESNDVVRPLVEI
jgi:2',3'-cyclic-nucleotide 2'-phosphodiesterase/3'-nucleotidase